MNTFQTSLLIFFVESFYKAHIKSLTKWNKEKHRSINVGSKPKGIKLTNNDMIWNEGLLEINTFWNVVKAKLCTLSGDEITKEEAKARDHNI